MLNLEPKMAALAMTFVDRFKAHTAPGDSLDDSKKGFKNLETTIVASMDNLREWGLSGMALWLLEKPGNKERKALLDLMKATLDHEEFLIRSYEPAFSGLKPRDFLKNIGRLTSDITRDDGSVRACGLDRTLYARSILERVLIFARHWVKHELALMKDHGHATDG